MLYQLGCVHDPVSVVQGTLLLTLWVSNQDECPDNSTWLSIAIQNARKLGAHHAQEPWGTSHHTFTQLKRLWWVCLIRDRVIALGYRRPLQIADNNWNADCRLLFSEEVQNEMCQSRVYSPKTRNILFRVFVSIFEFSCTLTNILNMVFPPLGDLLSPGTKASASLQQAEIFERSLCDWYNKSRRMLTNLDPNIEQNDSILLFHHLLKMYLQ